MNQKRNQRVEQCKIPQDVKMREADASKIDAIRAELGIAAPEQCKIPQDVKMTAADSSKIDAIRAELGITAPEQCQVPKDIKMTAADSSKIDAIRAELGITVPEQCKIPQDVKMTAADTSKIDAIRASFGLNKPQPHVVKLNKDGSLEKESLTTLVAHFKEHPAKLKQMPKMSAEDFLKDLGYPTDNLLNTNQDPAFVASDTLGAEEMKNEDDHDKPAFPTRDKACGIVVLDNGPYIVVGEVRLSDSMIEDNEDGDSVGWIDGKERKTPDSYALCRCGHSKHKPYCDGTHLTIDWDWDCTAKTVPYAEAAKIYEAADGLYLLDQENLCAILRYCDPDGSCWKLVQDPKTLAQGVKETCSCASGRLTLLKDGKLIEPDFEPEIVPIDDRPRHRIGPLWVKGGIPIELNDGTMYEVRNRVTLCRCGRSKNKPFCDGEHLRGDNTLDGSDTPENFHPDAK